MISNSYGVFFENHDQHKKLTTHVFDSNQKGGGHLFDIADWCPSQNWRTIKPISNDNGKVCGYVFTAVGEFRYGVLADLTIVTLSPWTLTSLFEKLSTRFSGTLT